MPIARILYCVHGLNKKMWVTAVWDGKQWVRKSCMKPINGRVVEVDYSTLAESK